MKISQFCVSLSEYFSCEILYADPGQDIYSFKSLFNKNAESGILYVAENSAPALESPRASLNLLFFLEELPYMDELRARFPQANLILIKKTESISRDALYDVISDIFLADNRFIARVNRLSQISGSGRGLQALIDEAALLLESPIIIIDTSYRLIAMSDSIQAEDEHQLAEQRRIGMLTENNLLRMRRDNIFERIRRQPDRMLYGIAPDAHHWWMNMLVYVNGIEAAEMGIMENRRKFTDYDFELMQHLRSLISAEMRQGHSFGAGYGAADPLLVTELLEQAFNTDEILRYRARLLNWPDAPFYFVLSVFPETRDSNGRQLQRQADILISQLVHLLPKTYWRIGENDLVFIVLSQSRDCRALSENQRLLELLRSNHFSAILSNPVSRLREIHRAYQQTLGLYRLREYLADSSPLRLYEDHYILLIADTLRQTHDLEDFYYSYVMAIRDYDRVYHTDYLRTLYEYLTHVENPALIARNLNIHKNTLYYRINKLKELFPADLSDGRIRLRIQLTLELMRLEQMNASEAE